MSIDSPPARRRPPTQAERRAETQAALLDATIECLVTYGYAKTTTGRIAELAGVSRGAQLSYFRNRAELVGAAVTHLAEKRVAAATERLTGEMTLEQCLDALWAEHQGEIFEAALELWVASRTDPELHASMQQVERHVAVAIGRFAHSALGALTERPDFIEDLIFALATIRGLALLQISDGASLSAVGARWERTRERLVRVLDPA